MVSMELRVEKWTLLSMHPGILLELELPMELVDFADFCTFLPLAFLLQEWSPGNSHSSSFPSSEPQGGYHCCLSLCPAFSSSPQTHCSSAGSRPGR